MTTYMKIKHMRDEFWIAVEWESEQAYSGRDVEHNRRFLFTEDQVIDHFTVNEDMPGDDGFLPPAI